MADHRGSFGRQSIATPFPARAACGGRAGRPDVCRARVVAPVAGRAIIVQQLRPHVLRRPARQRAGPRGQMAHVASAAVSVQSFAPARRPHGQLRRRPVQQPARRLMPAQHEALCGHVQPRPLLPAGLIPGRRLPYPSTLGAPQPGRGAVQPACVALEGLGEAKLRRTTLPSA